MSAAEDRIAGKVEEALAFDITGMTAGDVTDWFTGECTAGLTPGERTEVAERAILRLLDED